MDFMDVGLFGVGVLRIILFDCFCTVLMHTHTCYMQVGIQTRTVADLTAVANFVRSNNVPLLFVALLLLQFLSMVVDRLVSLSNKLVHNIIGNNYLRS